MRATHLLLVSMLGLGGIATAAASDFAANAGEAGSARQSASEGASAQSAGSGSGSGGDAMDLSRPPAQRNAGASHAAPAANGGDESPATGSSIESAPKHVSLGWQSLLPGSIQ